MGPIEVRRRSDGHVQLELDLCYDTECDLLLEAPMAGGDANSTSRHLNEASAWSSTRTDPANHSMLQHIFRGG